MWWGKKRVSQYNLNLYFSYPELNWIFFHMFKGYLHFVSLLIFSPFFSRVFGFFFLKVLYMPGMIINGKYFSFFFFLLCSQRPPQSFPFNLCTRIYESFTLLLLDFWVTVKNIFFSFLGYGGTPHILFYYLYGFIFLIHLKLLSGVKKWITFLTCTIYLSKASTLLALQFMYIYSPIQFRGKISCIALKLGDLYLMFKNKKSYFYSWKSYYDLLYIAIKHFERFFFLSFLFFSFLQLLEINHIHS